MLVMSGTYLLSPSSQHSYLDYCKSFLFSIYWSEPSQINLSKIQSMFIQLVLLKNHWILFHYLEIKSILIILVPTLFSTPTCYIILIFHNSSFQCCQLNQSCSPESIVYFLPLPLASCYFPCNLSLLSLFPSISPTPPVFEYSLWGL